MCDCLECKHALYDSEGLDGCNHANRKELEGFFDGCGTDFNAPNPDNMDCPKFEQVD